MWSAGPTNANQYTALSRLAFVLRGGSSDTIDGNADNTIPSDADRQQLIGIIDLRPKPDSDSILLLQTNKDDEDDDDDSIFGIVQEALFPPAKHDEIPVDEAEMDEQAASSNSIGNLCSTVYLVVAYDFEKGKTVLHRSFGGSKLMTFVDGVRSRLSQTINQDQEGYTTKLILLLVPSSPASTASFLSGLESSDVPENELLTNISKPLLNKIVIDLTDDNADWNASGAKFLVDRLTETFLLGGEDYQNMHPFEVETVGAFNVGMEKSDTEPDGYASDVIVRHIVCALRDDARGGNAIIKAIPVGTTVANKFQDTVSHSYKSSGGVCNVDFHTRN